ncbi:hypothetical protein LWE69_09395 [Paenibacillus sp. UKAQ_18]|nr:hypothetical protein [Paenibacillus sp. UKAQ_18]
MNPSICIDKLQLVTRMERDKIKFILSMGTFNKGTKYFYNVYRSTNPQYEININPTSISAYKNYNVMILFNPAKVKIVPTTLVNFIGMSHSWKMRRVDIAFDFQTPMRRSFYKPFQNTTINKREDNDNCYYGNNRSKCMILHYDKKIEQEEKEFTLPTSALTRFEFRLKEDLNKQPRLHDLDFEWMRSHLEVY